MTTEAREKLRAQLGCVLMGIAILTAMAASAYWLLAAMFSDVGKHMVGPT